MEMKTVCIKKKKKKKSAQLMIDLTFKDSEKATA